MSQQSAIPRLAEVTEMPAATGNGAAPSFIMPRWSFIALALLVGGALGLLCGVLALRLTTPAYTASMVVAPTSGNGIAGLGLRVPEPLVPAGQAEGSSLNERRAGEVVSDFEYFRHLLTAAHTASVLAADEALMRRLFPSHWHADKGEWTALDQGALTSLSAWLSGTGKSTGAGNDFTSANGDDGVALSLCLRRNLDVLRLGESALYRLRLRHHDRAVALELLQRLVSTADGSMRAEARRRTETQIEHLNRQIEATVIASHREAMTALLSRYLQTDMMLAVDLPFAADVIEPPTASRQPDWPPALAVAAACMLAAMTLALILLFAWQQRRAA